MPSSPGHRSLARPCVAPAVRVVPHAGGSRSLCLHTPVSPCAAGPRGTGGALGSAHPGAAPRRSSASVVSVGPPGPVWACTRGGHRPACGWRAGRGRRSPSRGGTGGGGRSVHVGAGRVARASGAWAVVSAQGGASWRCGPARTASRPRHRASLAARASSRGQTSGTDRTASRVGPHRHHRGAWRQAGAQDGGSACGGLLWCGVRPHPPRGAGGDICHPTGRGTVVRAPRVGSGRG